MVVSHSLGTRCIANAKHTRLRLGENKKPKEKLDNGKGSRRLVGRVSSFPLRTDTLLTKPFWLIENFVQDTSCHLLDDHKTKPWTYKEMVNS
jgi:hypothetical protein